MKKSYAISWRHNKYIVLTHTPQRWILHQPTNVRYWLKLDPSKIPNRHCSHNWWETSQTCYLKVTVRNWTWLKPKPTCSTPYPLQQCTPPPTVFEQAAPKKRPCTDYLPTTYPQLTHHFFTVQLVHDYHHHDICQETPTTSRRTMSLDLQYTL